MKNKILFIAFVISVLNLFGITFTVPLLSATASVVAEEKIETWAGNHPRAAVELGTWAHTYKEPARQLFKWDFIHPEQTKLFVNWVNTHQGKGIDAFTAQHTDWSRLNRISTRYRTALGDFVVWCRFHPKATTDLMRHQRALNWVGRHLYESS